MFSYSVVQTSAQQARTAAEVAKVTSQLVALLDKAGQWLRVFATPTSVSASISSSVRVLRGLRSTSGLLGSVASSFLLFSQWFFSNLFRVSPAVRRPARREPLVALPLADSFA